jgi:hypothetical protein
LLPRELFDLWLPEPPDERRRADAGGITVGSASRWWVRESGKGLPDKPELLIDRRLEWVLDALFINNLAVLLLLLLLWFRLSREKLLSSVEALLGVCGIDDMTGNAE